LQFLADSGYGQWCFDSHRATINPRFRRPSTAPAACILQEATLPNSWRHVEELILELHTAQVCFLDFPACQVIDQPSELAFTTSSSQRRHSNTHRPLIFGLWHQTSLLTNTLLALVGLCYARTRIRTCTSVYARGCTWVAADEGRRLHSAHSAEEDDPKHRFVNYQRHSHHVHLRARHTLQHHGMAIITTSHPSTSRHNCQHYAMAVISTRHHLALRPTR
jgi:hypothetical protein